MEKIKRNKEKGFTLIELMIVVAIIGILSMVAYPSYQSSVRKANRADGIDTLLNLSARLEEHFMNKDKYTGTDATVVNLIGSATSKEGKYTVAITSANNFGYVLTATPVTADSECGNLIYNSTGEKSVSATGATASNCW